jgi:hypothetical protein
VAEGGGLENRFTRWVTWVRIPPAPFFASLRTASRLRCAFIRRSPDVFYRDEDGTNGRPFKVEICGMYIF